MPKRICVFCSSSTGIDSDFFTQAERFCEGLASRGWEMNYGGATVGLMGHFADQALKRNVAVRGAIPKYLAAEGEILHTGLTELVHVPDLFERKRWMMEKSDAFVVFPGGFGTLDEALEAITWKLLGQHDKPVVFVNLKGFWRSQLQSYDEMVQAGVVRPEALSLYEVAEDIEATFVALHRGFAPTPGD